MHKNANKQHSYSPTVLGRKPGLEHECEANAWKFSLRGQNTAELSEIRENVSLWKFPETIQAEGIIISNSKRKIFQSLLRKTASRTRY